ncbi:hypothetical protein BJ508DRAFT_367932 [Ascobolus immersus RN42]|uniref:Uncharacterized protein n=1 Tax=Ascobolus immersus RN42 TaxID=1160509 RepID=A0A3N4HFR6_ASCIM|nr:hypothetical protein BJ508DRAFT_367932 [Ascobolus immersus RN42]
MAEPPLSFASMAMKSTAEYIAPAIGATLSATPTAAAVVRPNSIDPHHLFPYTINFVENADFALTITEGDIIRVPFDVQMAGPGTLSSSFQQTAQGTGPRKVHTVLVTGIEHDNLECRISGYLLRSFSKYGATTFQKVQTMLASGTWQYMLPVTNPVFRPIGPLLPPVNLGFVALKTSWLDVAAQRTSTIHNNIRPGRYVQTFVPRGRVPDSELARIRTHIASLPPPPNPQAPTPQAAARSRALYDAAHNAGALGVPFVIPTTTPTEVPGPASPTNSTFGESSPTRLFETPKVSRPSSQELHPLVQHAILQKVDPKFRLLLNQIAQIPPHLFPDLPANLPTTTTCTLLITRTKTRWSQDMMGSIAELSGYLIRYELTQHEARLPHLLPLPCLHPFFASNSTFQPRLRLPYLSAHQEYLDISQEYTAVFRTPADYLYTMDPPRRIEMAEFMRLTKYRRVAVLGEEPMRSETSSDRRWMVVPEGVEEAKGVEGESDYFEREREMIRCSEYASVDERRRSGMLERGWWAGRRWRCL